MFLLPCCSETRPGKAAESTTFFSSSLAKRGAEEEACSGDWVRVVRPTVTPATKHKHRMSDSLFGINAEFFHGPIDYAHPKLADVCVEELGCAVIRWPGGTGANGYNIFDEKLDEETMVIGGKEIAMENVKFKQINECIARSKTDGKYKVKDFGTFNNRCNGKIAVSLVLNVCTRDETHTRAVCERLKQENVNVAFCEIGNEVYFPQYAQFIDAVEEYAERCDKHAKMAKFFTPSVRLGWWRAARFGQTKVF